jgi:hypothetical protein
MRLPMWSHAVWFAAACLVSASPPVEGQTITSASVTGTVHDSSNALVPGAAVEIRNHDTGQVRRTITDDGGRFRLQYLPAGDYHLSVQLIGFTTANANLRLAAGDQVDVPITLTPAGVTEAVQVDAPAPLVEARRTQIAAAISPNEVDTLPLNGRNYLDLATLVPNVSRTNLRTTDRFAETSAVPGTGISVAGQRNLGNTLIVDGLSANDDAADLAGTFLSEEVIREQRQHAQRPSRWSRAQFAASLLLWQRGRRLRHVVAGSAGLARVRGSPSACRGDAGGIQRLQPRQRRCCEQHVRDRNGAVTGIQAGDGDRRHAADAIGRSVEFLKDATRDA